MGETQQVKGRGSIINRLGNLFDWIVIRLVFTALYLLLGIVVWYMVTQLW